MQLDILKTVWTYFCDDIYNKEIYNIYNIFVWSFFGKQGTDAKSNIFVLINKVIKHVIYFLIIYKFYLTE